MQSAIAVAMLEKELIRGGELIILRRVGATTVDISVLAKVEALSANTLRQGSSSSQGNYRAIISPTAVLAASATFTWPIRSTDKVMRNGQERSITLVNAVAFGSSVVRVELDFLG